MFAWWNINFNVFSTALKPRKGPFHTLKSSATETNGKKFNFFRWIEARNDLSDNQQQCSYGAEPSDGANYFCKAMYGDKSKSISFKKGTYKESGSKGWIVSRRQNCIPSITGNSFHETDCPEIDSSSGMPKQKCYIHQCTNGNEVCKTGKLSGLYDIVCTPGKLFVYQVTD